jgi:histidinol-phosphate phosphatase family protein
MDAPLIIPSPDWTLFLDRDGVINIEKENDYIHHWDEFVFYEGAPQAIAQLSTLFHRIIIVTNQKGVGKGVTQLADLEQIHRNMKAEIEAAGGRIDAIYYCPDTDNDSPRRKPNAGMAFDAAADFPDINLQRSVVVGNNLSDLHFGRNAGMHTVFLRTTQPLLELPAGLADMEANSLSHLCKLWQTTNNPC